MDRETVFNALRAELAHLLPDLDIDKITQRDSLQDLGANSIDRFDIITNTMYRLPLQKKPELTDFLECKNIADIISVFSAVQ